jgi:hypothetical protein
VHGCGGGQRERRVTGAAEGGSGPGGGILAGRYRIVRQLGAGAMGAVYLAEHLRMGRLDAIKVISREMAGSPEALARFEREARNASFINHPNVCQIYDFGETEEGLAFLAMEYIEGETLTDVAAREGGRLPVERALRLILQVADALEAAHSRSIVHRDLKPDNIMLTRGRDGADVVKVVDFGIAKGIGDEEGQVTRLGFVIGTPEYMSPEQLSGDRLDGRSDIYSLALVLIRLVTGRFPFTAATAQELMLKRLTDPPLPLAELAPDLRFPAGLQDILDRALARNAGERFRSAGELHEALTAVQGEASQPGGMAPSLPATRAGPGAPRTLAPADMPVTPGRPTPPESGAASKGRPGRTAIASVGGIALAVVAVGLWFALGGEEAPAPGDPAPSGVGEVRRTPMAGGGADDALSLPPAAGAAVPADPGSTVGQAANPGNSGAVPPPAPAPGGGGQGGGGVSPPRAGAVLIDPAAARPLVSRQLGAFEDAVSGGGDVPTGPEVRRMLEAGGGEEVQRIRGIMAAGRDTLAAVLADERVPAAIRAQAAFYLGVLAEGTPGVLREEVVSWYRRAVQLDPDNTAYRRTLEGYQGGGG